MGDVRVQSSGPRRRSGPRRARGRVEGPGHRAAAPARADRPRRLREARGVQARVDPPALQERQPAEPVGLLAPVRDPDRVGDADAALALHARGADRGRDAEEGGRLAAPGRRGGKLGLGGDGVAAGRLRPALPLDGRRRRELGPARGGARPGRLPAREARRPAPPGEGRRSGTRRSSSSSRSS